MSQEVMADMDIVHMTKKDVAVVNPDYTLTDVLHKLVDESFLPVVDKDGLFQGIITRKSILKAVNALLHDFSKEYGDSKQMREWIVAFLDENRIVQ